MGVLMQTVSAREFENDLSAAKRAAAREPVVITDRGEPAFVLLSIEEYRRITCRSRSVVEQLRGDDANDFNPPKLPIEFRVPEL